jgi:hypothetical protein
MAKIRKIHFVVKLNRPVCRTPIKPGQRHKSALDYTRKPKHRGKSFDFSL